MVSRTSTVLPFLCKEREKVKMREGRDGHDTALLVLRQGLSKLRKGADHKTSAETNRTWRS